MLNQFKFGEFGVVISDNPETTSVLFEPDIDTVIKNNCHDRMLFKNAFDDLLLKYEEIKKLSETLDIKLRTEIMSDIDWLMDYLDDEYTKDYKFSLFEEGWIIK